MLEKWFYKTMLFLLVRSVFLYKKNDDGLGVVDTQPKHILDGNEYNYLIDDADLSVVEMGNNITIENEVMAVKKIILQYYYQTKRLAEYFYKQKSEDILKLIFDFSNNHIRYKNDDEDNEQIRTPARTWHDRATGIDCDCFSVFIGSILKNLGIPFVLRIAHYGKDWQHIYIVAKIGNYEIPLDPVIRKYNYEKPYLYKKDYEV